MRIANSSRGGIVEVNTSYEAESMVVKLRRIMEEKEPIDDVAPIIYTDKKNGVMKEYDIRTDRFDVALEAMGIMREAELAALAKSESVPTADAGVAGEEGVQGQP